MIITYNSSIYSDQADFVFRLGAPVIRTNQVHYIQHVVVVEAAKGLPDNHIDLVSSCFNFGVAHIETDGIQYI